MLTWLIILGLILLGLGFMLVEMLLLPGVSIGAVLSVGSFAGAIYVAFDGLGTEVGVWVIVASIVLTMALFLWAIKTGVWSAISLKEQVGSSSSAEPSSILPLGSQGVAMSRLAPMGRARFGDVVIEAKSLEAFIDPKSDVEIVGYDNAAVIVKLIKK